MRDSSARRARFESCGIRVTPRACQLGSMRKRAETWGNSEESCGRETGATRVVFAPTVFCKCLKLKDFEMAPKKGGFQLFLQRVVGMWVDFFVLAPNQNSGWALVNSSIGLSVSAGNACAHFFANRRTRSIPRRPSSVRVTGQTSQMRVSETGKKRARVKAVIASAAVVNTTTTRAAHAAESPKAHHARHAAKQHFFNCLFGNDSYVHR